LAALAAAVVVGSTGVVATGAVATGAGATTANPSTGRDACTTAQPGHASCFAVVRTDIAGHVLATRAASPTFSPGGYHPTDLQNAYKLTGAIGKTGTVAIVDSFDNPNAESDLAVYRKQFGLPACTTSNGCFKKVNQNGAAFPLPPGNADWGVEISLDLDMVSAICPNCKIVLVEAKDDSLNNLGIAAKKAGTMAHIVSNSYGTNDFSGAGSFSSYWATAGVIQVVSTGDHNYNGSPYSGPQVPAVYKTVTAVGGTSLNRASNARGWTEKVWKTDSATGANSGCSISIAKPAWQHDTICKKRMIADVAAVADLATGVSIYDTFSAGGWMVAGGTSVSAPIIAGVYALAGNAASIPNNASHIYGHAGSLFDVTTGNNGTCGGSYLCTAKPGYDGPTGLGTPNGVGAF
jgi:subtilase family serine protease